MPGYTLSDGISLKNKLGAKSHDELEKLEGGYVAARLLEIAAGLGPQGRFDTTHLKALHQHLFQDVFEWAGHTRDERVKLSDGAVASEPILRKINGRPFAIGAAIPVALDEISLKLGANHQLRDLPREAFAARAADLMAEINNVHPFREGNGRTQRAFVTELAKAAGHRLAFSVISKERMIQASIAAHEQDDPSLMRRMFVEISDPARVAALREAIAFFDQQGFGWNEHYLATTEPGQKLEVVFAGRAGAHFMARTEAQILIGNASDLPDPQPERGDRFMLTTPEAQPTREHVPAPDRTKPKGRGGR